MKSRFTCLLGASRVFASQCLALLLISTLVVDPACAGSLRYRPVRRPWLAITETPTEKTAVRVEQRPAQTKPPIPQPNQPPRQPWFALGSKPTEKIPSGSNSTWVRERAARRILTLGYHAARRQLFTQQAM